MRSPGLNRSVRGAHMLRVLQRDRSIISERCMKIMYIAPFAPLPLTQGNSARGLAVINTLEEAGHEVHFCHVPRGKREVDLSGEMHARFGPRLHSMPRIRPRANRMIKDLAFKFTRFPRLYNLPLDDWYPSGFDDAIARLLSAYKFDVVIVNYVFLSAAFDSLPDGVMKVLDTHDVFSNRYDAIRPVVSSRCFFSTNLEDEKRGLERADVVVAIHNEDAKFFNSKLCVKKPIVTVGHRVDIPPLSAPPRLPTIGFIGSSNRLNLSSVRRLVEEIAPAVRKHIPTLKVRLAGGAAKNIDSTNWLENCGVVDSVTDFISGCSVMINPMDAGTGLKIKNMEALGCGRPVVTSVCGSQGIPGDGSAGLFMCLDNSDMVDRCCELLSDARKWRIASENARRYCEVQNRVSRESLCGIFS